MHSGTLTLGTSATTVERFIFIGDVCTARVPAHVSTQRITSPESRSVEVQTMPPATTMHESTHACTRGRGWRSVGFVGEANIVMAYIVIACIVMAHAVMIRFVGEAPSMVESLDAETSGSESEAVNV